MITRRNGACVAGAPALERRNRAALSGARRCLLVCGWLLTTPAALAEAPSTPPAKPASSGSSTTPAPAIKPAAPVSTTRPDVPAVPREAGSVGSGPAKKIQAAPPPLDLAALEKRLRETDAVGVFTKLTLKNQVDDLLDRFRAFYQGHLKGSLAQLRQPYDLLLMKTIAVVQDGDPELAGTIASSREAIWEVLADREKLAALESGV